MKRSLESDQPRHWDRWSAYYGADFLPLTPSTQPLLFDLSENGDEAALLMLVVAQPLDPLDPAHDMDKRLNFDAFEKRMDAVRRYFDAQRVNSRTLQTMKDIGVIQKPSRDDLLIFYLFTGQVDEAIGVLLPQPLRDLFHACPMEDVPYTRTQKPRKRVVPFWRGLIHTILQTNVGTIAPWFKIAVELANGLDGDLSKVPVMSDRSIPYEFRQSRGHALLVNPTPQMKSKFVDLCKQFNIPDNVIARFDAAFLAEVESIYSIVRSRQQEIEYACARALVNDETIRSFLHDKTQSEAYLMGLLCRSMPPTPAIAKSRYSRNVLSSLQTNMYEDPKHVDRVATNMRHLGMQVHLDIDTPVTLAMLDLLLATKSSYMQTALALVDADPIDILLKRRKELEPDFVQFVLRSLSPVYLQRFQQAVPEAATRYLPLSPVSSPDVFSVHRVPFEQERSLLRLAENPLFAPNLRALATMPLTEVFNAFNFASHRLVSATGEPSNFKIAVQSVELFEFIVRSRLFGMTSPVQQDENLMDPNTKMELIIGLFAMIDLNKTSDAVLQRFVETLQTLEADFVRGFLHPRFVRAFVDYCVDHAMQFNCTVISTVALFRMEPISRTLMLHTYMNMYALQSRQAAISPISPAQLAFMQRAFIDHGSYPLFTTSDGYRAFEQLFYVTDPYSRQAPLLHRLSARERAVYDALINNPHYAALRAAGL